MYCCCFCLSDGFILPDPTDKWYYSLLGMSVWGYPYIFTRTIVVHAENVLAYKYFFTAKLNLHIRYKSNFKEVSFIQT